MRTFRRFARFAGLGRVRSGKDTGYITVPIVLTAPDGTVFTDENGVVLTYGTKRVRPIEESEE